MKKSILFAYFLPLLILAVATLGARLWHWDERLASFIYENGGESWRFAKTQPWHALYEHGDKPATLLGGVALFLFIFSYLASYLRLAELRIFLKKIRRQCLYLFSALIIAPGIIVNLLLKQRWGRPRPRDVELWGGEEKFEPILTIDPSSDGTSFSCGHCSVGFYFFVLFFLFAHKSAATRWGFFIFACIYGIAMSVARTLAGAHFFSDAVWSAAIVYFTALILAKFILNNDKDKRDMLSS